MVCSKHPKQRLKKGNKYPEKQINLWDQERGQLLHRLAHQHRVETSL